MVRQTGAPDCCKAAISCAAFTFAVSASRSAGPLRPCAPPMMCASSRFCAAAVRMSRTDRAPPTIPGSGIFRSWKPRASVIRSSFASAFPIFGRAPFVTTRSASIPSGISAIKFRIPRVASSSGLPIFIPKIGTFRIPGPEKAPVVWISGLMSPCQTAFKPSSEIVPRKNPATMLARAGSASYSRPASPNPDLTHAAIGLKTRAAARATGFVT